jgi:hypothetical protein
MKNNTGSQEPVKKNNTDSKEPVRRRRVLTVSDSDEEQYWH